MLTHYRILRSAIVATVTCCFFGAAAFSQSADWQGLFRDAINRNRTISNAAGSLWSETLLPALLAEDATALDVDLASIVGSFHDENQEIRLQASAVLFVLAMFRVDATESMKRAVPFWLAQFDDKNPRVRENAIRAIVILRPAVPSEAVPALLRLLGDRRVEMMAVGGLLRASSSSAEALRGVVDMMSPDKPIETRREVVKAIGSFSVSDPVLIRKLGEALRDRDLILDALGAISYLGPRAMALRPLLVELAVDDRDKQVSEAAAAALKRLELR